jgi:hypothetical protein
VVPLERLGVFFLFLGVVFLVEPFFPVSEQLDNPNVSEVTDLIETLRGVEVFIFFSEYHFKFFLSKEMVIGKLWLDHFLSELIVVVTCTWNRQFGSTRFP